MTNTRPSLGFDDDVPEKPVVDVMDLSDFQPKPVLRPDKVNIAEAAEKANFKSREPKLTAVPLPVAMKPTRRRRTGRSAQLNLKVRQDTIDAFYAIADAKGWVLGEAFEKAVALLEKEYR